MREAGRVIFRWADLPEGPRFRVGGSPGFVAGRGFSRGLRWPGGSLRLAGHGCPGLATWVSADGISATGSRAVRSRAGRFGLDGSGSPVSASPGLRLDSSASRVSASRVSDWTVRPAPVSDWTVRPGAALPAGCGPRVPAAVPASQPRFQRSSCRVLAGPAALSGCLGPALAASALCAAPSRTGLLPGQQPDAQRCQAPNSRPSST